MIQKEGNDRLIIEIPEETDVKRAEELVKKVGVLEFKEQDVRTNRWKTVLTGASLKPNSAKTGIEPSGKSYVSIEFNSEGAKKFGEITKRNIKKPIAIYFDNKEISSPVVQSAILGGSVVELLNLRKLGISEKTKKSAMKEKKNIELKKDIDPKRRK